MPYLRTFFSFVLKYFMLYLCHTKELEISRYTPLFINTNLIKSRAKETLPVLNPIN